MAVRTVNGNDLNDENHAALAKRLKRFEFSVPILEKYPDDWAFYGIYDVPRQGSERVSPHFCARAVVFFEDVARVLPHARIEDKHVFSHIENRKRVTTHLKRERSRLLAAQREDHSGS